MTFIDERLGHAVEARGHPSMKLAGGMPEALIVTLANLIYFEKARCRKRWPIA